MKIKNPYNMKGRWFKGNIHTHTNKSDGCLSPEKVCQWYEKKGYDFLAITDHKQITEMDFNRRRLLAIPGMELDCDVSHILGLNLRSEAENKPTMGRIIAGIRKAKGISIIAHPYWNGLSSKDLLKLNGYTGIEIFNQTCHWLNGKGYSLMLWDELLSAGKCVWGFASDDAHFGDRPDSGKAWIMVKCASLSTRNVIGAIQRGSFYSSTGPEIKKITVDKDKISVSTSPVEKINFIAQRMHGRVFAKGNRPLKSATFKAHEGLRYIRIECVDKKGNAAFSNPLLIQ